MHQIPRRRQTEGGNEIQRPFGTAERSEGLAADRRQHHGINFRGKDEIHFVNGRVKRAGRHFPFHFISRVLHHGDDLFIQRRVFGVADGQKYNLIAVFDHIIGHGRDLRGGQLGFGRYGKGREFFTGLFPESGNHQRQIARTVGHGFGDHGFRFRHSFGFFFFGRGFGFGGFTDYDGVIRYFFPFVRRFFFIDDADFDFHIHAVVIDGFFLLFRFFFLLMRRRFFSFAFDNIRQFPFGFHIGQSKNGIFHHMDAAAADPHGMEDIGALAVSHCDLAHFGHDPCHHALSPGRSKGADNLIIDKNRPFHVESGLNHFQIIFQFLQIRGFFQQITAAADQQIRGADFSFNRLPAVAAHGGHIEFVFGFPGIRGKYHDLHIFILTAQRADETHQNQFVIGTAVTVISGNTYLCHVFFLLPFLF